MKSSCLSVISLFAAVTMLAAACGGGDKKPAATAAAPTEEPTAASTAKAAGKTPATAKTASSDNATKNEKAFGGLFNSLFNGALSGGAGGGATGLGEGDPSLTKYLPSDDDLPPGYTPQGQYTFRAPDGISETGGMDIATEIAVAGDVSASQPDFSKMGILMAMVIKPDDLQSLGEAFDSVKDLDAQELQDALEQGTGDAGIFTIKDVKVLEAKGLGDGNVGFQMTIDLGGLADMFSGLGAVVDATPGPGAPDFSNLQINMRMYLFARGDYAGGILRMAFTDSLSDDVDEVGLAKIIDDKLKSAP